jgi:hypothetical protein
MAKSKKYLKLVTIGCGSSVLLALLVVGALVGSVFLEYREAALLRDELDTTHPTPATFTPARDGSVPADRLQSFIAVRRVLYPRCEDVARLQRAFAKMEAYEEKDRVAPMELLRDVTRVVKVLPTVGRHFGEYLTARNEALRANGMGLGEYTWIYVVTYHSWLGHRPLQAIEGGPHPSMFFVRVIPQVRAMMQRHVDDAADDEELAAWRSELTVLEQDARRIPFEDGLPPELESSLVPHRGELERLACPEAAELDVVLTEKAWIGYDHR